MRKMHSFRFNDPLIDKVRGIATKENRTVTNLIETVLIKFTEDYEKDNIKRPMGKSSKG